MQVKWALRPVQPLWRCAPAASGAVTREGAAVQRHEPVAACRKPRDARSRRSHRGTICREPAARDVCRSDVAAGQCSHCWRKRAAGRTPAGCELRARCNGSQGCALGSWQARPGRLVPGVGLRGLNASLSCRSLSQHANGVLCHAVADSTVSARQSSDIQMGVDDAASCCTATCSWTALRLRSLIIATHERPVHGTHAAGV